MPIASFLRDAHFLVSAVYFAQRIADFTHSCVGAHCIDDVRHCIRVGHSAVGFHHRILRSGFLERIEAALDFFV